MVQKSGDSSWALGAERGVNGGPIPDLHSKTANALFAG